MYFTKYEMVSSFFEQLGFPTWMIYPLACLKVLGVIAIVTGVSKFLMEWAYAGFFFDAAAAMAAHYLAGDGMMRTSILAFLAVVISRALLSYRSSKKPSNS